MLMDPVLPTPAPVVPRPQGKPALGPMRVPTSVALFPIKRGVLPSLAHPRPSRLRIREASSVEPSSVSAPGVPIKGLKAYLAGRLAQPLRHVPPVKIYGTSPDHLQGPDTDHGIDRGSETTRPLSPISKKEVAVLRKILSATGQW